MKLKDIQSRFNQEEPASSVPTEEKLLLELSYLLGVVQSLKGALEYYSHESPLIGNPFVAREALKRFQES